MRQERIMNKKTLILTGVIAITCLLAKFIYPYIEMEFASSAYYTQEDRKKI